MNYDDNLEYIREEMEATDVCGESDAMAEAHEQQEAELCARGWQAMAFCRHCGLSLVLPTDRRLGFCARCQA